MAQEKGLLLYISDYSRFEKLSPKDCQGLLLALFDYIEGESDPKVPEKARREFKEITAHLDKSKKKYEETCKRRAEAAQKRWEQERKKNEHEDDANALKTNANAMQNSMQSDMQKNANAQICIENDMQKNAYSYSNSNYKSYSKSNSYSYISDTNVSDIDMSVGEDKSPPARSRSHSHFKPPTVEEVSEYCRERNNGINPQRFVDYYTANGWKVGKNAMRDWKAAVRTWEGKDGVNNQRAESPRDNQSNSGSSLSDLSAWEDMALNIDPSKL